MTNHELEIKLLNLTQDERRITNEILVLINLADQRKLYLERGYGSLFEWLTKAFHYSESAAQRRIQAARLLLSVPEISAKLSSGEVNLTMLAKVQSAIRLQERVSGAKLSNKAKAHLVERIENKTGLETEKALLEIFPEISLKTEQERRTVMSDSVTRLSLNLSDETMQNLERIKDLLSHVLPEGNLANVIDYISQDFLKKKDPLEQTSQLQRKPFTVTERTHSTKNTAAAKQRVISKAIPSSTRRAVLQSTQGKCSYRDSETGRVCNSTYQVEVDHIYPRSLGGENDRWNLRCLCRKHNQFIAQVLLGESTASYWRAEQRR